MKRLILMAITCVVVDQLKYQHGWLTKCKGVEALGEVVFVEQVKRGKAVTYKPFVVEGDEFIHGLILDISNPVPEVPKVQESSDTGKSVDPT